MFGKELSRWRGFMLAEILALREVGHGYLILQLVIQAWMFFLQSFATRFSLLWCSKSVICS